MSDPSGMVPLMLRTGTSTERAFRAAASLEVMAKALQDAARDLGGSGLPAAVGAAQALEAAQHRLRAARQALQATMQP
jgi:hypothetical protein